MLDEVFRIGYLRGLHKQATLTGVGLSMKPSLFPTIKAAPSPLKKAKSILKMPASGTATTAGAPGVSPTIGTLP